MPRVKLEYKTQRRAQIIAAARACFARAGFHRTTLQDVFAEAGLSAGCIYNYFQSKEELILAIAEERHRDEGRAIADESNTMDPVEALRSIAQRFVADYLREDGREKRHIAIQTWSEAMLNPCILQTVIRGFEEPKLRIATLSRRGQSLGKLSRKLDADSAARMMIALFHGFILQMLWEPNLDSANAFALFKKFLDSMSVEHDLDIN